MRVAALEHDVGFRAYDEERRTEREHVEPLESDVATVHYVDCGDPRQDFVEDIDVMHFSIGTPLFVGPKPMEARRGGARIARTTRAASSPLSVRGATGRRAKASASSAELFEARQDTARVAGVEIQRTTWTVLAQQNGLPSVNRLKRSAAAICPDSADAQERPCEASVPVKVP